jgi:hypothetical protein
MLVYGHCGDRDGEEVMLASIVVVVVIGGQVLELGPVSGGTRGRPP